MNWGSLIGISVVILIMVFFQWPKIKPNFKKEKAAFITFSAIAWLLAIILLSFPDLPGPTQMIDFLYKPLGKLLEK